MKPRKLKLIADVMGMQTPIAEVHIRNFADEQQLNEWTELVCPSCLQPTKYHGSSYECEACQQTFTWYGKLARIIKGTKRILEIPRLIKEGETVTGKLYKMKRVDFAKYCDATKSERGFTVSDTGSAHNLFKLLVATERLEYVVIVVYKDTNEEVIALLKISDSNRILLREIIPINLVKMKETLMLNREEITEQDAMEAKAFIEQFIPEAKEDNLKVNDYRTAWLNEVIAEKQVKEEPERVVQIKEIMARAKQ